MKKAICNAAIMFVAAMSMASMSAFSVSAGNTGDSSWKNNDESWRVKQDSTSVYVNNTSGNSTKVSVWGEGSLGGTAQADVSRPVGGGTYYQTKDLTIPGNSKRLIKQYVYENGCLYAHIKFTGSGAGYWSPDSVGSYTYAN